MIKLRAKKDLIVRNFEHFDPPCVPVVIAAHFELAAVLAMESDLEYEGFALLEDDLNLLDVLGKHASLREHLSSTSARLAIAQSESQAAQADIDLGEGDLSSSQCLDLARGDLVHAHDVRDGNLANKWLDGLLGQELLAARNRADACLLDVQLKLNIANGLCGPVECSAECLELLAHFLHLVRDNRIARINRILINRRRQREVFIRRIDLAWHLSLGLPT